MGKLMKNMAEQKKADEQKEKYASFIFDEDRVLKPKDFEFFKISNKLAGLGLLLPKEKDIYDKNKNFVGKEQVCVPVIITSDNQMFELSRDFQRQHKIKFLSLPDETALTRRWSLPSIKDYLINNNKPVSASELFIKIKNTYKKFHYFSSDNWYNIHTLWDMATYFYPLFKYFPFMELRGAKGTAKSKIMTTSRLFSFNPSDEMTNPSESTLFREVRKTKYIDEAEKIFYFNPKTKRIEQDSRAEVINSSYKYTGSVSRMEKDGNRFVKKTFHTFSPIMIASINGLFGATEDRAIVHITTKAPVNDARMEMDADEDNPEYQAIRDELYIFLLQNWVEVENIYNNLKVKKLKERDFRLWQPLLTIAKTIDNNNNLPEGLFEKVQEFAEKLTSIKKIDDLNDGLEYQVIKATFFLLEAGKDFILIKDVIATLPEKYKETHNKTIAKIIDNLGFRENKEHSREGWGYTIGLVEFKELINAQHSLFFQSLQSLSHNPSISEENLVTESDENNKDVTEKGDGMTEMTE